MKTNGASVWSNFGRVMNAVDKIFDYPITDEIKNTVGNATNPTTWPYISNILWTSMGWSYKDGVYKFDVPGVTKEQLSVEMDDMGITVKCDVPRVYNFNVPIYEELDQNTVQTDLKDGILTISFKIRQKEQPKKRKLL